MENYKGWGKGPLMYMCWPLSRRFYKGPESFDYKSNRQEQNRREEAGEVWQVLEASRKEAVPEPKCRH